jgi:hypothetical protein
MTAMSQAATSATAAPDLSSLAPADVLQGRMKMRGASQGL